MLIYQHSFYGYKSFLGPVHMKCFIVLCLINTIMNSEQEYH